MDTANIAGGLTIFVIGLFKKVVLANGISPYADAVFNAAESGLIPGFNESWIGALAYTFQLYFDFSGYSDMAIGLSWLFNVRLPFNFNSPYQAINISDFWRRWHMTLSRFLRDYLYIPLGGNRRGTVRQNLNLLLTMLSGGLWHGANWSFIFWGFLHGCFLIINHGFQALVSKGSKAANTHFLFVFLSWLLTFLLVVVAWVFFRATSFSGATRILESMAKPMLAYSLDTIHPLFWNQDLHPEVGLLFCALLGAVAFFLPNSNRIGDMILQRCRQRCTLRPFIIGMTCTFGILLIIINSLRTSTSAFIYFNF